MHGSARIVSLLLISVLVGCAGVRAAPESPLANQESAIRGLNTSFTPDRVLDCLNTPLPQQDICRNTITQALLVAIDLRYADFEIGFFNTNRLGGFATTLATLGLGAAGSVSGAAAANAISAAITGITGAREAFSREVLADQTAAALLTAMRAQRNIALLRVREGLARPATEYPLGFALSDLQAYFRGGTIPGALTGVTQAVGVQAQRAQDDLRNAIPVAQGSAARFLQRLISDRNPEVARENERRIRVAMDTVGVAASVQPFDFVWDVVPAREAQLVAVARLLDWKPQGGER